MVKISPQRYYLIIYICAREKRNPICICMKKQRKQAHLPSKSNRTHRVTFLFNEEEYNAVSRHLVKYKITNKSSWYRTMILKHVIKVMEEDYPTLFNKKEMRG
jgi:hypothetical protein